MLLNKFVYINNKLIYELIWKMQSFICDKLMQWHGEEDLLL
jgi:hypothetical protein